MARILPRHGISSTSRGESPTSQNGRPLVSGDTVGPSTRVVGYGAWSWTRSSQTVDCSDPADSLHAHCRSADLRPLARRGVPAARLPVRGPRFGRGAWANRIGQIRQRTFDPEL